MWTVVSTVNGEERRAAVEDEDDARRAAAQMVAGGGYEAVAVLDADGHALDIADDVNARRRYLDDVAGTYGPAV